MRHAAVSLPSFSIGFRAEPGEDLIHQAAVGTLAAELLLGESSALYETLYEASLIDADFSACFTQVPGAALLQAGGTGRRPDAVLAAILRGAEQALAQLARGNELALLPGKGAIINRKGHFHRGFRDLHKGDRP